jgi:integrase
VHIRRHGILHYIDFGRELRLKTGELESCVRSVPIHPKLVELGFIDYSARCDGLLFPGIPQHKSGRYSDAPSKAFSRHLKKIGIKRPRLSFHSLRHTFIDRLKTFAPDQLETRERLVGHATKGIAGIYGGDYEAEAKDMGLLQHRAEVLARIRFVD